MMSDVDAAKKVVVCVTGASGYIASWLVKLLLDRPNYTVKATVRNLNDPRKVEHLKALEGAAERLRLFQADLMEDGSFDSAIDGCDCVFHVASPCFISSNDPQRELIEPAVKGTLNVLKSCAKVTSIKRVVLTASMGSVAYNANPKGPDVLVDETWYSDKAFCEQSELWYPLSKLLAEEAAWNFAEENGIDLVVMNPGFVIGPLLQPTLNFTSEAVTLNILTGKEIFPTYHLVDVRDVAYAHILAFENRAAKGRYLLVGSRVTVSDFKQILNNLYPSLSLATDGPENAYATLYKVSKEKAYSLGVSFTPLEKSLKDTVESFLDKNFFSLPYLRQD